MSVINGYGGLLSQDNGSNTIGGIRSWTINSSSTNPKGTPSNAGRMQVVLPNQVTDWTLRYDFYGKELPALPGTSYTFLGYNGSERASGTVICESVVMNVDIEGGGIISGSATFGSNGALTQASGSAPTVGTGSALTMYGGTGCKANWQPIIAGTTGSAADIPDVRNWSLSIACQLSPYVSSSTAGVTGRTAANYSASGSFDFYQGALSYITASATRMSVGNYGILKLYVSSTEFFGLSYAVINRVDEPVQNETGANNSIQVGFDFSGWANISGTMTRGTLLRPDTTAFWS